MNKQTRRSEGRDLTKWKHKSRPYDDSEEDTPKGTRKILYREDPRVT